MKNLTLIIILIGIIGLIGCASQADKDAAYSIDQKIANVSEVTFNNASEVKDIKVEYEALSDKQKKLVTRKDDLQKLASDAEKIIIENDPSNNIKRSDMSGIWRETVADSHRGFIYFKDDGSIYYMGSKDDNVSIYDFTPNYLMASSYELVGFDTNKMGKPGSFYNSDLNSTYHFVVSVNNEGQMKMELTGSPISGTYIKQESVETIRTDVKMCIVDGCTNEATHKINGTSGIEWYCDEHYQFLESFANEIYSYLPD